MFFFDRSPSATRLFTLILFLGSLIYIGLVGYEVIHALVTGEAIYRQDRWGVLKIAITREADPVKFEEFLNTNYFRMAVAAVVGTIAFVFNRKLSD